MNHDDEFHQRWELRRREIDGDSTSDDSISNSSHGTVDKGHKLVTDLVLLENDDASYISECLRHDKLDICNSIDSQTGKAAKKKIKSSKKKKKSERCSKKKKRNINTKDMESLVDLKVFADSLICELTVAREDMFAHMREEMRKLESRSNFEPLRKHVRFSQKNKECPQNGIETGAKPQSCSGGSMDRNMRSNVLNKLSKAVEEALKHDEILEPVAIPNDLPKADRFRLPTTARMVLASGSHSSSCLTQPTILPKPQFQNHINHIPLSDHIPAGTEIGRLMDARNSYHRFAEFQAEQQFGSFSHIKSRSVGLPGQNSSQTLSLGIGFPIPLHQELAGGSNVPSLTYYNNLFLDNSKVGPRMNDIVISPASSECIFPKGVSSNMVHKTDAEFVSVGSQDLKNGQFYLSSLRNEQ